MTVPGPEERAEGIVIMFLDGRLEDANEPPGLRDTAIERLARKLDDIDERVKDQIYQLRSASSWRIPDAYFADEEAAENEFQRGAAGIRAARARAGVLSDPRQFEDGLADLIGPSALWALRTEASRVPRPLTRASSLSWSLAPVPWAEDEGAWPPAGAAALGGVRQLAGPDAGPVRVTEKPYKDWVQLGMFEFQRSLATRHPEVPARQLFIATGIEAIGGPPSAHSFPMRGASADRWTAIAGLLPLLDQNRAQAVLETIEGPLASLANNRGGLGESDEYRGVGLPPFTVVPGLEVVSYLGLRPETPALRHVLVDDHGPAIVGRQWSGFLIHAGDYSPLEPGVQGSDVILRPDLYDALERTVGKDRLNLGLVISQIERKHRPGKSAADE